MRRILVAILVAGCLAAPALAETIFSEGFEGGDLCAWSAAVGGAFLYSESFDGADSDPWPAPWTAIGSVALADLEGGRARFRPTPSSYSLARLYAPVTTQNVEVRFTLVFEDVGSQGVGFYVRQNGGYLNQTFPAGQGYAVFVEGFRGPGIGVWREVGGTETSIQILFDAALDFQDGVAYRVRFRVEQIDGSTTMLRAKVWPVAQAEPANWHVEVTDSTPELQGIAGGMALDSWSDIQAPGSIVAHTLVDDIEIEGLCPP